MEIGSGPSSQVQLEVLKKSTEVQEQAVSRIIQDSTEQLKAQQETVEQTQKSSGSALTGLGTGLDISA